MSKKKNTLQDLDDFLKQQAATLVKPEPLPLSKETQEEATVTPSPDIKISAESITTLIVAAETSDPSFRLKLYDFIIQSLEAQKQSLPEDKMLINTALYLKNGSNWKDCIRQYWKEH